MEYALDTMKLAKKSGLKNTWVTNGYMTHETLKEVVPYLDAANVDLKSFSDDFYKKNCGASLQPVLNNLKMLKKMGVWVEISTLVIPTLSDSDQTFKDIARFIFDELGVETPWHVLKFVPEISLSLQHLPETSTETLEKAAHIGLETGLKYVYSGGIVGQASEDTYCPKCNSVNIDRTGFDVVRLDKNGFCFKCGENLNIIGE
jgi:pyruvate formate lyase activating enzyme